MEDVKRGAGQRGGMFQHPLMVRLAATEKTRLEWLARQKQKAMGTLAREMLTDVLTELMAPGTPLRQKFEREMSSKRRNTPIERAARKRPAPPVVGTVELVPIASPTSSAPSDEQTS